MLIQALDSFMEYTSGYKYQLSKDISFKIPSLEPFAGHKGYYLEILPEGILLIKKGYACDGASGPTIDTKSSMRGAFVHDSLYQLIRAGILPKSFRPVADKILKEMCIIDGMWEWRAGVWERMVAKHGEVNALPSHRKVIQYAP